MCSWHVESIYQANLTESKQSKNKKNSGHLLWCVSVEGQSQDAPVDNICYELTTLLHLMRRQRHHSSLIVSTVGDLQARRDTSGRNARTTLLVADKRKQR